MLDEACSIVICWRLTASVKWRVLPFEVPTLESGSLSEWLLCQQLSLVISFWRHRPELENEVKLVDRVAVYQPPCTLACTRDLSSQMHSNRGLTIGVPSHARRLYHLSCCSVPHCVVSHDALLLLQMLPLLLYPYFSLATSSCTSHSLPLSPISPDSVRCTHARTYAHFSCGIVRKVQRTAP